MPKFAISKTVIEVRPGTCVDVRKRAIDAVPSKTLVMSAISPTSERIRSGTVEKLVITLIAV
jgi:hypothetical protein